jgi:predicted restriction endonuclease
MPAIINESAPTSTEAAANVMSRLGQGQFRSNLIAYWGACAVTGCKLLPILRASHIKPWSHSNDIERLDVHNGILLVPNLDVLFDEGLISFDDEGRMLVSPLLDEGHRKLFRVPAKSKLCVTERHTPYLKYHRENVFVSGKT